MKTLTISNGQRVHNLNTEEEIENQHKMLMTPYKKYLGPPDILPRSLDGRGLKRGDRVGRKGRGGLGAPYDFSVFTNAVRCYVSTISTDCNIHQFIFR